MTTMNYRVTYGKQTIARFVSYHDAVAFAKHVVEHDLEDRTVLVIATNGSLQWNSRNHTGVMT